MARRSSRPVSLFAELPRFLSRAECADIGQRVLDLAQGGGETAVRIVSQWTGEIAWARNAPSTAADRRDNLVSVQRAHGSALAVASTNQTDPDSLAAAVRAAERDLRHSRHPLTSPQRLADPAVSHRYPATQIWSDATMAQTAAARGADANALIAPARRAGLLSAGRLSARARGTALVDSRGRNLYARETAAECSITVVNSNGAGAGWAGATCRDTCQLDVAELAATAVRKCESSRSPVAVEPGRYTVVFEPQAVYALAWQLVSALNRGLAEFGSGPFADRVSSRYGVGMARLGQRVVDPRLSITQDPADPMLGIVPFSDEATDAEPYQQVEWVDGGVLAALADDRSYALANLHRNLGTPNASAFRMSGGSSGVDEMVRSTERGLLVSRLHALFTLDERTLLTTGLTSGGFWLIENGRITKAVKNMRFTDSPLFAFNSVEMLGTPVSVYADPEQFLPAWAVAAELTMPPIRPAIVPPMKVRDFSFTGLADAI